MEWHSHHMPKAGNSFFLKERTSSKNRQVFLISTWCIPIKHQFAHKSKAAVKWSKPKFGPWTLKKHVGYYGLSMDFTASNMGPIYRMQTDNGNFMSHCTTYPRLFIGRLSSSRTSDYRVGEPPTAIAVTRMVSKRVLWGIGRQVGVFLAVAALPFRYWLFIQAADSGYMHTSS